MHQNNRYNKPHGQSYDLAKLIRVLPTLSEFVVEKHGKLSIDFSDPRSVKALNQALLLSDFKLQFWDLPEPFLCPAVPGRLDYILALGDLLAESNASTIPTGKRVTVIDIGTGANLIYPILGSEEFGWKFVGVDVNDIAIQCAKQIVNANSRLRKQIELRLQTDANRIFANVVQRNDRFLASMCNPPFYESAEQAAQANRRKVANLGGSTDSQRNFSGNPLELHCPGGELAFISQMIKESAQYAKQVLWFTTLVSQNKTLPHLDKLLSDTGVAEIKTIAMGQGQKISRILAWSYYPIEQHSDWIADNS